MDIHEVFPDEVILEDDYGIKFVQVIEYEWRLLQCKACKKFSHDKKGCDLQMNSVKESGKNNDDGQTKDDLDSNDLKKKATRIVSITNSKLVFELHNLGGILKGESSKISDEECITVLNSRNKRINSKNMIG